MRRKFFSTRSALRRQRGAAAVEFAIVIFVMLLIVAGIIGFGRTFWYSDALTKATRDGARFLSTWKIDPVASPISAGVSKARDITINSANAARVSPQLGSDKVVVECLDASFAVIGCTDAAPPANVRVSISGFSVAIGEWFPFIGEGGVINYGSVGLAPQTTMRYMN